MTNNYCLFVCLFVCLLGMYCVNVTAFYKTFFLLFVVVVVVLFCFVWGEGRLTSIYIGAPCLYMLLAWQF